MKSSKKDFVAEAEELFDQAGRLLIELQDTCATGINPDTINALFRTLHTLKGISGLFGYKDLGDYSHALESLLDDIRLGKIDLSDEVVRFLFLHVDALKMAVDDITSDRPYDIASGQGEIESFRAVQKKKQAGEGQDDPLCRIDQSIVKVLSEYEEHRLRTNIKEGKSICLAKAVFALMDFDKGLGQLTGQIKSHGELIATLPTSADLPPDSIGFSLLFGSAKPADELNELLGVDIAVLKEGKTESPPLAPVAPSAPAAAPKTQEVTLKSSTTSVRVDIEKLDGILNTISELSLAKGATVRIANEMAEIYGRADLVVDVMKISQTLGRKVADLQEQVLGIRMVPIGQIFSRLGQIIKRYARETGKEIELLLFGEETEIDKFLAEEIVDPLMHIVRNAMDHGIETPEERRKGGKKANGTITLRAFQRGHHVVVEVSDDGAGIDTEVVLRKAREKGLVAEDTALEERQILDFIFMPGFSTKATVSEVSGRGVGMDIVKSKLAVFGGFVDLRTEKGAGTTFTLTMPITLAIVKALVVEIGSEKFGIPLTSLMETLVISLSDLQTIEGREVYNLRGELLPVVNTARVFDIESSSADRSFVVVIRYGDKSFGLLVDELIGQHEIVVKSLGDYLSGLRGFAGAAEIGRHEVILVLDVDTVIEESTVRQRTVQHV